MLQLNNDSMCCDRDPAESNKFFFNECAKKKKGQLIC